MKKNFYIALLILPFIITLIIIINSSLNTLNWTDDIMYMDAGINLASGHGWNSTLWPSQSYKDFYWGNNILFPLSLSLWIKAFGFTFITVKMFTIFIFLIDIFLLILVLKLYNISIINSIYINTLFISSTWVTYILTHQRGELLQLLILLLILYFSISRLKNRFLIIIPLSGILFINGIHSVISIILILILIRNTALKKYKESYIFILIGFTGGLIIWLLVGTVNLGFIKGLTTTFASQFSITGKLAQGVVLGNYSAVVNYLDQINPEKIITSLFSDYLIVILSAYSYLLITINQTLNRGKLIVISNFNFIGIIFTGIFIFVLAGRFARYYYPLILMPALVYYAIEINSYQENKYIKLFLLYILLTCTLVSNYHNFLEVYQNGLMSRYNKVSNFILGNTKLEETVFIDPIFYTAAKKNTNQVFSYTSGGGRGYPKFIYGENLRITKIFCISKECESTINRIGGVWILSDELQLDDERYYLYLKK